MPRKPKGTTRKAETPLERYERRSVRLAKKLGIVPLPIDDPVLIRSIENYVDWLAPLGSPKPIWAKEYFEALAEKRAKSLT